MNTEIFTGKAESYAKARPSYPASAIDYIFSLVSKGAIFADIGAGTGKFTELIAKSGHTIFAVEPNTDMKEQLEITLKPYPNTKIIDGSAEDTTLENQSVDIITCAQALHWFEPSAFWKECGRIGKQKSIIVAIYNNTPGGSSIAHSKQSTDIFFNNPIKKEFPNPIFYTREKWLTYMTSHSHDPLPTDPNYSAHITEMNKIFDAENVDGLLKREVVTTVYSKVVFK